MIHVSSIHTARFVTIETVISHLPKHLGDQLEEVLGQEDTLPSRLVLTPIPVFLDELHEKVETCELLIALHDLLLPLPEDIEIARY